MDVEGTARPLRPRRHSGARHPDRGGAVMHAQRLRRLCDEHHPRLLPDPELQHPRGPLLLLFRRDRRRPDRACPPPLRPDAIGADHHLLHAGRGLLHPRYGLHPVHDPLPPRVDLLRHAGKQLGLPLQPVHPPVDDPPRGRTSPATSSKGFPKGGRFPGRRGRGPSVCGTDSSWRSPSP